MTRVLSADIIWSLDTPPIAESTYPLSTNCRSSVFAYAIEYFNGKLYTNYGVGNIYVLLNYVPPYTVWNEYSVGKLLIEFWYESAPPNEGDPKYK